MFTWVFNPDRLNKNPILSHFMNERHKKEKIGQFYVIVAYFLHLKGQHFLKCPRNEPNSAHFLVLETKNLHFWIYWSNPHGTPIDIGKIFSILHTTCFISTKIQIALSHFLMKTF